MLRKLFTTLIVLVGAFTFIFCAWGLTTEIRATTFEEMAMTYGVLTLMTLVGLAAATSPTWLRRLA